MLTGHTGGEAVVSVEVAESGGGRKQRDQVDRVEDVGGLTEINAAASAHASMRRMTQQLRVFSRWRVLFRYGATVRVAGIGCGQQCRFE